MTPRHGFRTKMRYWFDNTMSRGTPALVGWLGIFSLGLVIVVSIGLALAGVSNLFTLLWDNFGSAFGLDLPDESGVGVHILYFVLAIGGLFVISALVGLLNNGIGAKLDDLRKGRSIVVEKDHTVILGWSDQVFTVVEQLVTANSSRKRARIVILAEHDKIEMEEALRHRLEDTGTTRVVCRTGNPLDVTDLGMVSLNAARSIVVLAPQDLDREDADAYVLKTLLAINRGPAFRGKKHHVVTSVRDSSARTVALLAGGGNAVVVDGEDISARLIVQAARQSGLSAVYHDLLDFGGDELYVVSEPGLTGHMFGTALLAYQKCCPIGLVRADGTTTVNPPMDSIIAAGDQIVILASDDSTIRLGSQVMPAQESIVADDMPAPAPERTLILGWNGRAVRIIDQLDKYVAEGSTVEIITDREDARHALDKMSRSLRCLVADVKDGDTRDRAVLESLDVAAYHNVIVLCDDHLGPLTADSRVLVTLLHLRDILAKRGQVGAIVSEIRDDRDRELAQLTRDDDFVISEKLVSLLLTQISENRYLEPVFADLFDSAGAEIYIRDARNYVNPAAGLTFATVVAAARLRGEVAIGYRAAEDGEGPSIVLNPDKAALLPAIDRLVVLSNA